MVIGMASRACCVPRRPVYAEAAAHLVNLGGRLLPLAAKTPFLLQRTALERSLNQVFAEALDDGAFDVLDGHWMKLEVADLGLP